MDEGSIKLDDGVMKGQSSELLPEPLLIILAPPPSFLPVPGEQIMSWDRWLKSFEHYLDGLGGTELVDATKCVLLQNCLGQEGQRVYSVLIQGETTYAAAISALTAHFTSSQNLQTCRLKFRHRAQRSGETLEQFICALEELVKPCKYGDLQEKLILNQLIEKTNCIQLQERLLLERETLTLAKALVIGKETEAALTESALLCFQEVSPVQKVSRRGRPRRGENRVELKPHSTITPLISFECKNNYYDSESAPVYIQEVSLDSVDGLDHVQRVARSRRPQRGQRKANIKQQSTTTPSVSFGLKDNSYEIESAAVYYQEVSLDSVDSFEPPIQSVSRRGRPRRGEKRKKLKPHTTAKSKSSRQKHNDYKTESALIKSAALDLQEVTEDSVEQPVQRVVRRGRPRRGERRKNVKPHSTPSPSNSFENKDEHYSNSGDEAHIGVDKAEHNGSDVDGLSSSSSSSSFQVEKDSSNKASDAAADADVDAVVAAAAAADDDDDDDDDEEDSESDISNRKKGPSCPFCFDRRFRDAGKLARHMRTHTKEKPFTCPICAMNFSQSYHMTRHLRNQHGAGQHVCSVCGESLENYAELKAHKMIHMPQVLSCSVCQLKLQNVNEFSNHGVNNQEKPESSNSDNNEEYCQCRNEKDNDNICAGDQQVDSASGNDDTHDKGTQACIKTENIGYYVADSHIDGGDGGDDGGDEENIISKTKRKGHFCPICVDRRFRGPSKLARHMRTHTKDKPFICPVCTVTFSQSYHMTRHMRKQHDLGQYICARCGKSLANRMELKVHKRTHTPEGLTCPICDRQFKANSLLINHIKTHNKVKSNPQSVSCAECGKVFGRMYHLKRHLETHRKSADTECYKCPYCQKSFPLLEDLSKHLENHVKETSGTCPKCNKTFSSPEELERHMEVHEKSYVCSTCGKKFKVEYAWKKHEQGHKEQQFYCSLCRKHFPKLSHYKRHLLVHKRRESKCPHCDCIFLKLTAFKFHLRTHTEERPYQCSCCIETFTQKEELDQHCLKHRKLKKERPYSCTRCDYAFSTLMELTEHMSSHVGEQPLNCPECGKTFLNKNKLEKHFSIHTGERPHLCSICGNGFPSAASLKLHMYIHTGEKIFKCSQCSKSYKSSSGLRLHSREHMAERPTYPCRECGRSYGRLTELKMHQRYHTGDKPYSCTCCNKCFISNHKLNIHMRVHTGERPYACPHCGQTFTQTGDRNRHMIKYH